MSDNYRTLDSEWNFALAYFKRWDEALRMANLSKFNSDWNKWLEALFILNDELVPQMKPEERIEVNELKQKCIKVMKARMNVDTYTMKGIISEYEVKLRIIMKERGMDMPRKSDPSRALLN